MEIRFLDHESALDLHRDMIARYGGSHGLRSPELLDSALAQASASFGGEFLHSGLYEMAAAYLFHIVKNHPFIDGNKRAGAVAALLFLELNGIVVAAPKGALSDLVLDVVAGTSGKPEIADFLRRHTKESGGADGASAR